MDAPASLEELCRPVFVVFCNYWQLQQMGTSLPMEKFRSDIQTALGNAKVQAASDPNLSREYERIERPLAFFIDFMVHDGKFPFGRDWRELGRNYNELSGDEKFFNLLSEALGDSNAQNLVPLFYTMLGLGFEGAYAQNRGYIAKTMRECAARLPGDLDLMEEPIVKLDLEKRLAGAKKGQALKPLRKTLLVSLLLLLISLIVNFRFFYNTTRPFRESLTAATSQVREIKILPSEVP
jgi:hypothetical protein